MVRTMFHPLAIAALIQLTLGMGMSLPSLAQEWEMRVKPRGTLRVVELHRPSASIMVNYAEGLVLLDKDNKLSCGLARDWR